MFIKKLKFNKYSQISHLSLHNFIYNLTMINFTSLFNQYRSAANNTINDILNQ